MTRRPARVAVLLTVFGTALILIGGVTAAADVPGQALAPALVVVGAASLMAAALVAHRQRRRTRESGAR